MVDNVPHVGPTGGSVPARQLKNAYQTPQTTRGDDAVQLSSDVMQLRGVEGIRLDKVLEVKRAIAEGTYLTAQKLDQALDKAIDEALEKE